MRALVDLLGQQLFFKDMQPAHLAILADCAARAEFAADKVVFEKEAAADYFYLVIRGRLVLEVPGNEGQWQAVQAIEPGEVVGVVVACAAALLALSGPCCRADPGHRLGRAHFEAEMR